MTRWIARAEKPRRLSAVARIAFAPGGNAHASRSPRPSSSAFVAATMPRDAARRA
jgi:hypothetical protein